MSNKQSSVEWAIEKITMICAFYNRKEISVETFEWYHKDIVTKAKAMHKEEIERAHYEGSVIVISKPDDDMLQLSQQYYNETFGGNNDN